MAPESENNLRLEIGHVLFIDLVGYSKLLIEEQKERLSQLTDIVLETPQVRAATNEQLVRLPTGDGMALVFRNSSEEPVRCALEIAQALKKHPDISVRMGIHSGPVSEVTDVNGRTNIAGAGINMAQRVMDCGDAGHILVSKRVADDLLSYRHWEPYLRDLGEVEVKHMAKIGIFNLYTDELGNPALPEKLRPARGRRMAATSLIGRKLRRFVWSGAIALLVIAVALAWLVLRNRPALSVAVEKKVAVLPFKPLVAASGDDVLEMGMADSLITKLSNIHQIIVSSLPSVRKYGGIDQDPLAAGRKLQVDTVLDGNLQKEGDHIRVTARLLRVVDGASLWAGTFDEKFTDVFAVEDAISERVAGTLALHLGGEEKKQITKRSTDNLEAYQLYLTGRYHWNLLSPAEITKSIDYFQHAIAVDPGYALAYFGLADAYRALCINGDRRPSELLPKAKAAAQKAIELDDTLAEPHVTLCFVDMWLDWDWSGAEKEARRALSLNPNLALAHSAHAQLFTALGAHSQAVGEAARARELDPVSPIVNALEGMTLFYAGRYDEADARLQKALELGPRLWVAFLFHGYVLLEKNDLAGATAALTQARDFSGGGSQPVSMLAWTAAREGDTAKARSILGQMQSTAGQRYVPPFNIAVVYLALGERDQAFAFLDKACQERDIVLIFLRDDKRWDAVRGDPRFIAVLNRIGLDRRIDFPQEILGSSNSSRPESPFSYRSGH